MGVSENKTVSFYNVYNDKMKICTDENKAQFKMSGEAGRPSSSSLPDGYVA